MPYSKRTVPQLITTGVYDSSLLYSAGTEKTVHRRVSMFEIELPIGVGGVSHIDKDEYAVSENTIICGKPGQIRHTELPYKCYYIHVIVEDKYYAELLSELPDVFEISDRNKYKSYFEELISKSTVPSKENDLYLQYKMIEIIYMLTKEAKHAKRKSAVTRSNADSVSSAIEYIKQHFDEDLNLDDIASGVHLSSIYFHNMFKAAVGITPHKYLLNVRLSNAKKLLSITDMPFSEIASRCGFPSQSYFNYVFKREFGITPKKYRTNVSLSWNE